jgi:hypothetical protein
VRVDIRLNTTDEFIDQSKDVVTPINTKTLDTITTNQVNHDKIKPKIKKDKIIRVPYSHPYQQIHSEKESTYQYPMVPK